MADKTAKKTDDKAAAKDDGKTPSENEAATDQAVGDDDEAGNGSDPQLFDSTDERRTANSVVRHQYRELTDAEKAQMQELKDLGAAFLECCDSIGTSRELSLAKTKAEEAVMWAVKHVTQPK